MSKSEWATHPSPSSRLEIDYDACNRQIRSGIETGDPFGALVSLQDPGDAINSVTMVKRLAS